MNPTNIDQAAELMERALKAARGGVASGQTPFGCAISIDGQPLAAAHNSVLATPDITAHAEVNALREACRASGNHLLVGAIVATTCEPCAMCMAALHWARVDTVYFGATIADATAAGFNELQLPAAEVLRLGDSGVKLVGGVMTAECRQMMADWAASPERKLY